MMLFVAMVFGVVAVGHCSTNTRPSRPLPKPVETCKVVTVKNQLACKKVILGTFPDNPNWLCYFKGGVPCDQPKK